MSEQTQSNNQQTVVIALVVVAVLLAALIGVLIYQQSNQSKLAQQSATATTDAANSSTNAQTTNQLAAEVPFDAKTATKVPAGMTPEQLVKKYNDDVVAGKYDAAFKLLPAAVQTKTYGDAKSYAEQLKQYGISGYKIGQPQTSGDTVSIVSEQQTAAMAIAYTWKFKKVGGQWYVESRVMGGSVQ